MGRLISQLTPRQIEGQRMSRAIRYHQTEYRKRQLKYHKKRRQIPEVKSRLSAYYKEYRKRPKVKERLARYGYFYGMEYRQRPEVKHKIIGINEYEIYKTKHRERQRLYIQRIKEKRAKMVSELKYKSPFNW